MNRLKWLVAGAVLGVIAVAFRDLERGTWLSPALPRGGVDAPDGQEPILGYDGMTQETLLDWLDSADPDSETIERIKRYEKINRNREPVLQALADLPG